jgi:hypothetical protein
MSSNGKRGNVVASTGAVLRSFLIDIPLALLFGLLLTTLIVQHAYLGYITTIIDSYRRGNRDDEGFYTDFDFEHTYYNRQCGPEDISTTDANDLLIHDDFSGDEASHVMMTHGAVMFKNVLTNETASELRNYLESRHDIQDQLPWHEKFYEEIGRLALGLGANDHPVIAEALRQVATHAVVKRSVEAIVGPDPAIVEIST